MEIRGLLPNGSLVSLRSNGKKVMTVGICQKSEADSSHVYDYAGVLYPAGYRDAESLILFDREQIARVYMLGYQDEEAFDFAARVESYSSRFGKEGDPS